jgi:hypothetical protein
MRRLHRRDDAELRKPRQVLRRHDLRMLDPPTQLAPTPGSKRLRERVKHQAVAAVTDRVNGDLRAARLGAREV